MRIPTVNAMIREYQERIHFYKDFAALISSLLKAFLADAGIHHYAIHFRAKSPESLREKIERKRAQGKSCNKLTDITDLAGVQVILYFSDDVSRVISLLDNEFECVEECSLEETIQVVKTDRGYDAVHKIIRLTPRRARLSEYRHFKGCFCEVQIKTILQQAWAEIEHDIGYKPKVRESDLERSEIRKLFKHNAQLLKTVDENFVAIRERHLAILSQYTERIKHRKLKSLSVNFETVRAYVRNELSKKTIPRDLIIRVLELSQTHRIKNLHQLDQRLRETGYLKEYFD